METETGQKPATELKFIQQIFETAPAGVLLFDEDEKLVLANKKAKELFLEGGLDGEISWSDLLEKNNTLKYDFSPQKLFHKVKVEKKAVTNVFLRGLFGDNEKTIKLTLDPFFDDEEVTGVIVRAEDVTHFIDQQEELQQSFVKATQEKDRWQAVFSTVEEGIFAVDRGFNITKFNHASEFLSGYSEEEVLGERYDKIFKCMNKHGFIPVGLSSINKVFITKEAVPYDEHIHINKDGREYWVGLSHTPIFNKEGEVEECIVVMRDVSRIKELEKARTEFVSIASHELRTPLTIVNGYLDLLLSGQLGEFGEESKRDFHKSLVNKVYKESKRLKNLVDELLNVSLIEGGKMKLRMNKIRIDKLIEEVGEEMIQLAKNKRLNLVLSINGNKESSYIFGDPTKIKQVLTNLLDNALKFTNEGGKVELKGYSEGDRFVVQVADTGIGIPQRMLPHIFEKFQQVSGSYLKENKGTGLGLFIVKGIIELHGGNILAESKVGKGTTFIVNFPLIDRKDQI